MTNSNTLNGSEIVRNFIDLLKAAYSFCIQFEFEFNLSAIEIEYDKNEKLNINSLLTVDEDCPKRQRWLSFFWLTDLIQSSQYVLNS